MKVTEIILYEKCYRNRYSYQSKYLLISKRVYIYLRLIGVLMKMTLAKLIRGRFLFRDLRTQILKHLKMDFKHRILMIVVNPISLPILKNKNEIMARNS